MAPSIAELPVHSEATSFIVPVKAIPGSTEAKSVEVKVAKIETDTKPVEIEASEAKIETEAKPAEIKAPDIKAEKTQEKPKIRRVIDEEGGNTTATVFSSPHQRYSIMTDTITVPQLPSHLGPRREVLSS